MLLSNEPLRVWTCISISRSLKHCPMKFRSPTQALQFLWDYASNCKRMPQTADNLADVTYEWPVHVVSELTIPSGQGRTSNAAPQGCGARAGEPSRPFPIHDSVPNASRPYSN